MSHYIKISFSIAVIALVVLCLTIISTRHVPLQSNSSAVASSTTSVPTSTSSNTNTVVQKSAAKIEGIKVPSGWYTHQTYGMDNRMTVLSRTRELPNNPNIKQIDISDMTTPLTPEDFISHQGVVSGSLNSPDAEWSWGIYEGHKTFSITLSSNGVSQWFVYVFGGHTVYEFTLSPNDQTNPNLENDRADFWKVITYYVQNPSFEKLSRTETQQNCAMFTMPTDQEPTIQADPETGYAVVNFTKDGKKTYVFLNFNDDISQCTPSVAQILTTIKTQMRK